MMYFGDFGVLVCYISNKSIISLNKHEFQLVFIEKLRTLYACCSLQVHALAPVGTKVSKVVL